MEQRRAFCAALAILAATATTGSFAGADASIPALGHDPPGIAGGNRLHRTGSCRPGRVELRQGSPEAVTVEADDNLLPEIQTVVEGGKLHDPLRAQALGRRQARHPHHGHGPALRVHFRLRQRRRGGGEPRRADARDRSERLGGRQARQRAGRHLRASIAGSGDIQAGGKATEIVAKIAGSGDLEAGKLDSRRGVGVHRGSGDAVVRATESLSATIAGSGGVRYHGDPTVRKSVAGSGEVTRVGPAT